jgi:hypothetical protein
MAQLAFAAALSFDGVWRLAVYERRRRLSV